MANAAGGRGGGKNRGPRFNPKAQLDPTQVVHAPWPGLKKVKPYSPPKRRRGGK